MRIIFVHSGKGGVGKSTIAWELANALHEKGNIVGIFDADVHGPSLPTLSGLKSRLRIEGGSIIPHQHNDLHLLSFGFMTTSERPLVWTGSVLEGAIKHTLRNVRWPALDFLIIDMPPGTSEIHVTLLDHFKRSNALVVTTPNDLTIADARRGIELFLRSQTNILGLIENMSSFICSACGHDHMLDTSESNAQALIEYGLNVIAKLPFEPSRLYGVKTTVLSEKLVQIADYVDVNAI